MPNDFIELYENALDSATCRALIDRFEHAGQATRGRAGSGLDLEIKNSWDLDVTTHPDWQNETQLLHAVVFRSLVTYVRRYPHLVIGPFALRWADPAAGTTPLVTAEHVADYDDTRLARVLARLFRPGGVKIQKYVADEGGYPYWHSEIYPDRDETLHRVLLWMVYLNDDFRAGETEFKYQARCIVPRTGRLVIAPAAFTHTHRGNRPLGGDKFIVTSWILFQRAEVLLDDPQTHGPVAPGTRGIYWGTPDRSLARSTIDRRDA